MLYQKYRPRSFAEVIGQDEAISKLMMLKEKGLAGRSIWISGKTGHGKTTLARLIAQEVSLESMVVEVDSRTLKISDFEEIRAKLWRYCPMFGSAHVLIVNEAHKLRNDVVTYLLNLLESPEAQNTLFIFTTTTEGMELFEDEKLDAMPLLQRCNKIKLSSRAGNESTPLSKQFAERCKSIAEKEGIDGFPLSAYLKLAERCNNSLRGMLSAVETGDIK